ncbi:synaptopodin-2 [Pholidichthys leucotaenia]
MEPEPEDLNNNGKIAPWSGSEGSQELVSESLAESYKEDDLSEGEYPLDSQFDHIPESGHGLQEVLQSWASTGEQQSFHELSGSEEEVSYEEDDDTYLSGSRESITESPHIQTSLTSPALDPEQQASGLLSRPHSQSSSSSLSQAADKTLALTWTTEEPQEPSNRKGLGTGNSKLESSEEGGSSEAPPASVSFGISAEGAEQAGKWNSVSDTDLCRPDRHRARYTRLGHESQSEKHVKETKSKCKRIARLLTDAPNPQNKGALLFKKRRQRVKKYTLVSYGTGENSEDQIEEETEEVRSAEYNFVATSDSELEEQYSLYHQQHFSVNWGSFEEMEALPETKGKGVLMFAQRRKRMDEIVSEHEEMRSHGLPVEAHSSRERHVPPDQVNYMDTGLKQHAEYQENFQQMDHLSSVPKSLVSNRTAKPFLGFQDSITAPVSPGGVSPATKRNEPKFKIPVSINTSRQVWSPTGDFIASRDERISVPAIKTGILPEPKRKTTNKQPAKHAQESDLHNQKKGERRSYIESEEDCFSLGAEACNFMQPRAIKLKNPPPVAPKPTINPNCPPWMRRSPSSEPCPVGPHTQHYLQQQDWAQPQQMASRWVPDQTQETLQTPANSWAPISSSSQLRLHPTTNNWNQQQPRSLVSMQASSPTHIPTLPLQNKSDDTQNSIASCPPQGGKFYGHTSSKEINWASDGPTMAGKGAKLFAKRQSRMEKFVVDAETVQGNKPRSSSPTSSLPTSWRYSSNIRAPPPLSYNPLHTPFYPPLATKQTPATNLEVNPKTKEKPKSATKHLNALDVMKHQPYQLDSSLFKYDATPEPKCPSPKPVPVSKLSKFEVTKNLKLRSALSPYITSELADQSKPEAPDKSTGLGFGRSRKLSLPRRLSLVPSPGLLSPASTPGIQQSFLPTQRKTSIQEKVYKHPTPWEAASRSPIGSVDEAFMFQGLPSSVASNVKAAGHHRSLPEPPDEWKHRVSLDPAPVTESHYHNAAPAFRPLSTSRALSPGKPAFYGPPFKPAQPLNPARRASTGYMTT